MSFRKILAALALFATAAAARADVHPNTQSGFPVDQVFQVGEIDNVNLFNGALTLTIPVGQTYPVGGGFSYGLKLIYNSSPWRFETVTLDGIDYTQGIPSECSNAGLGWRVSLGRLDPPCQMPDVNGVQNLVYQDETGTDHIWYETLHVGDPEDAAIAGVQKILYTRDGSYLRMKVLTSGIREVESPDGTTRAFNAEGLPTEIRDRFGNSLAISYEVDQATSQPYWLLTDSQGRTQKVWFRTDLAPYAETVDRIELQAFGTDTAVYQFNYASRTIGVACPHNANGANGSGKTVPVPLLTSVTRPDGSSYQVAETDYLVTLPGSAEACIDHSGNLLKLTLPTLGKLAWTWQSYIFPTASSAKRHLQTSSGVATRQTQNANGTVLGTWTYASALQALGRELKVSVTDPLGYKTDRFYSTATDPAFTGWSKYDYSLPFTRSTTVNAGGVDLNLSSQVWNGATLLRSEYVLYERDPVNITYIAPDMYNTNRRPVRSRTVFHDDADRFADATSSSFDGLGHYRTTTVDGSFGTGDQRTTTVNFNPARGTYVVNAGANTGSGYNVFPGNQPWIPETYTSQQVTEGTETATTLFCFDSSTGFLNRKRVLKNSGTAESANDVLEVYGHTGGNVTSEQFFGGDKQTLTANNTTCTMALPATVPYQLTHTWSGGARATSQYAGMTFKSLDLTVDARTGLPATSRDTATLQTGFEYDALGRLTWSKPSAGDNDGWTEYEYSRALSSSSLAKVIVRKRANGSKSAAVLAQSEILFDAFGRVWRERQLLPNGTYSTRETLYDAAGHKASVSEAQSGTPTKKTEFLSYDAFGRPTTIRPADGSAHDVTFVYRGTREAVRTAKVGTTQSAGNVTESSSTTTERYDRQGRLRQVEEPSGAGGALVTTTYGYDVGNRLKSVSTPAAGTTQTRAFTYDNLGFLRSETHPEKGPSGNGTVTWSNYDARGHVGRKVDGPNDLDFTYDKAERLTQVQDHATSQILKDFSYASANGSGDWRLGKLRVATRYNNIPGIATVQVTETYVYGARQGRVSQRDTVASTGESFTQSFAYTPLGQPNSVSYPLCTHAGCQPAAPVFTDVPAGYWARPEIEAIYAVGVTKGCVESPRQYCPENNVTRTEMAAFLIRAIEGESYTPPACTAPTFSDVACSFWGAPWIEELYRRGLTTGCATNPLRYCPNSNVTNAEMVIFLLRAQEGTSYSPPTCTAAPFTDVLCSHWAASWIAEAKKRGIAVGDAGGNFYPGINVTRSQMAGYLVRGFDFPRAIDPATPRTVDLTYTNGLLTRVSAGVNLTYADLTYHPNLLINQVTHGNGVTETWSNDPNAMRRPGSIAATGPAASWSSGTYVYDGTGNITKMGPAWFTYDKVNRLTAGNVYTDPLGGGTGTQQGYTFDPFGNLTAITGANARNTPTTAATNRLTTGTYDAAGNLTGWNGAAYQYDRFNQMVRMTSGAQDWAYVYTADDERIWSYNLPANVSNWTLRDLSGQVLREYTNENGAWTVGTDYIHRNGQLLAAETRLGRRHFHLDHLGTPRLITNSVGYKKAYHVYYPFGEEATAFNQDSERMKFTGHERDLASGAGAGDDLDYMHARHYSPITLRFLSTDPADSASILQPQSWSKYAYALNNPNRYADPDGRETKLVVGLQTDRNPVGHIAISINDKVYSFGTNWTGGGEGKRDWGRSLDTYLAAQSDTRETKIITLAVTPEQEAALQRTLDQNNPNAPGAAPYQELGNSCVTVSEKALERSGIVSNEPGAMKIDSGGNLLQAGASGAVTPKGLEAQIRSAGLQTNTTVVGKRSQVSKLGALWNAIKERF